VTPNFNTHRRVSCGLNWHGDSRASAWSVPWLLVMIRDRAARLPLALSDTEFPGGHEIRPAKLQAAMQWLWALRATGLAHG